MITEAIFTIIYSIIKGLILTLLPTSATTIGDNMATAFSAFIQYYHKADLFLPTYEMAIVFGAILTLEFAVLTFKTSIFIYKRFRG